jgi:hypothetical protein
VSVTVRSASGTACETGLPVRAMMRAAEGFCPRAGWSSARRSGRSWRWKDHVAGADHAKVAGEHYLGVVEGSTAVTVVDRVAAILTADEAGLAEPGVDDAAGAVGVELHGAGEGSVVGGGPPPADRITLEVQGTSGPASSIVVRGHGSTSWCRYVFQAHLVDLGGDGDGVFASKQVSPTSRR